MGFWDFLWGKDTEPTPRFGEPFSPPEGFTGVLIDDRPESEKQKDPKFVEMVAAASPVPWREKKDSEIRRFGVQNQDGQFSCVANAGRKALRIIFKENHNLDVDFSSGHIYRRRVNYPDGGMSMPDLSRILESGTTLEQFKPSDGLSESQVNAMTFAPYMEEVGKVFKTGKLVDVPPFDIETVASIINVTKKGVVLFYYFTQSEWSREMPYIQSPDLNLYAPSTLRHAVTAVDFTLRNGVKCLVIEDSAHFGSINRRFITQMFHNKRAYTAAYPVNFKFEAPVGGKPQHFFAKTMNYGESSNEVAWLQKCLQHDGTFPSNIVVDTTKPANYFGITAESVLKFQKKYKVAPDSELDLIAGKKVGPATLTKLNSLYAA